MTGILSFMHLAVSQFFFDKLIPCNKVNQSKLMESLEQKKTILLIFLFKNAQLKLVCMLSTHYPL